jgi:hypothetical protein
MDDLSTPRQAFGCLDDNTPTLERHRQIRVAGGPGASLKEETCENTGSVAIRPAMAARSGNHDAP